MKCSICGNEINSEFGNDPYPVRTGNEDECCDRCSYKYVLYFRIGLMNSFNVEPVAEKLNKMSQKELESFIELSNLLADNEYDEEE